MDRESFPHLLDSVTGWPMFRTFWGNAVPPKNLDITVCENNDNGTLPMIDISFPDDVEVYFNGRKMHF